MKNIFSKTVIIAIVALFCSCNNDDEVTPENCTLATVTNYDGDDSEEQMQVMYQNGKIAQLVGSSLRYTYTYNSQGLVATKLYEEIAPQPNPDIIRVTYTYGSNNKIIEEVYAQKISGVFQNYARWTYVYNNSNKLDNSNFYHYENGSEVFQGTNTYYYTGANITKIVHESNDADNDPNYVYDYTIDTTKTNPFNAISEQFYAKDTYIDDDDSHFYPLFTNPNLVTSVKETEFNNTPVIENISYLYLPSPQGNNLLSEIKVDNTSYYKFTYNCN